MDIFNISNKLAHVPVDSAVGIRIATLDEFEIGGARLHHCAAAIPSVVEPHVHFRSPEVYIVIGGHGAMHFGHVEEDSPGFRVEWLDPVEVGSGDVFTVPAGMAHSLQNLGAEPLVITFFGSPDNLSTDRTIVERPSMLLRPDVEPR